ncbi:proteasome maturation protein-like [Styela clava]
MESQGLLHCNMKETLSIPREENDDFVINSTLRTGFKDVQKGVGSTHPIESSLKDYSANMLNIRMDMLRRTQGLYAPIQLQMEINTTAKGAQRLPCLPSSQLSKEIVLGDDIMLSHLDVFNDPFQSEIMGDPHIMTEHRAGLKLL